MHRKLKALRAMEDLSQADLAKIVGISEGNYRAKENMQRDFLITEVKKILEHFGKTFEEVFF